MPAGLIIAAGVAAGAQVLSSIAQYYQAAEARKASKAELEEIRRLFDSIKPPDYDATVYDPPELIMQTIPETAFDMSNVNPKAYAVAAKYIPEVASYIAEQNPQLVKMSAAGQLGRDAQIQALKDIRARTGEVSDAEAQDASARAMRDAQINSQSRQESVLQDANRRGQLGSGAMLAAQLQGGSDQMERGANLSSQAYLEALRNKLGAIRTEGEMGRQLGNDEFSQSAINADIINKFNQRASTNMNVYNQYAADTVNKGQLFNVQNAQNVTNQNTDTLNKSAIYNRNRQDDIASKIRADKVGERSYINQAGQQNWQNKLTNQNIANTIKRNSFQDQLDIAGGKSGIVYKNIGMNNEFTRDQNQAIQGLGKGVADTAMTAGYLVNKYPTKDPYADEEEEDTVG
jgi:hypothetical protein